MDTLNESTSSPTAEWQRVGTEPEGVPVMTKIDDGRGVRNEQPLKRRGRLWYFVDGSMYVYYTPTHWKPLHVDPERPAHDAPAEP